MKNNENKIKEMLQGKKSNLATKTLVRGIISTPAILLKAVELEPKVVDCFSSFIKYGNKNIFASSGVSNWWLIIMSFGLIASSIYEIKAKQKSNK